MSNPNATKLASMDELAKNGYLVASDDMMSVYAYRKDRYLILKNEDGSMKKITVISGFYR